MKAIHNTGLEIRKWLSTVFIPTKIQNESNSQPDTVTQVIKGDCIYPYKDTK